MTEQEWVGCSDPFAMLGHLRERPSDRKHLLFIVACWRAAWNLIPDAGSRKAVRLLEQLAETSAVRDNDVMFQQCEIGKGLWDRVWHPDQGMFQSQPPWDETTTAIAATFLVAGAATEQEDFDQASPYFGQAAAEADRAVVHAESVGQLSAWRSQTSSYAALLRHIVGNPFRPYLAPSSWPSAVVKLAEALYAGEDCSFGLHDALLEAGHTELAEHFRDKDHPKGCWALDMILART